MQGARVLIMGLTFKENCPDLRNTCVVDIVKELAEYGTQVDVFDPWVKPEETQSEYNITPIAVLEQGAYDDIVLAVGHDQTMQMGVKKIHALAKAEHVLYDLKYLFTAAKSDFTPVSLIFY